MANEDKFVEDALNTIRNMSTTEFTSLLEKSGAKPRRKLFANPTSDHSEAMHVFVSQILKENIILLASNKLKREDIAEMLGLTNPNMVSNLKKRTTYSFDRLLTFCFLCTKSKIAEIRIPTLRELIDIRFEELGLDTDEFINLISSKGWTVPSLKDYWFEHFTMEKDYLLSSFLMDLPGFWYGLSARIELMKFQVEAGLYSVGGQKIDEIPGFMYHTAKS